MMLSRVFTSEILFRLSKGKCLIVVRRVYLFQEMRWWVERPRTLRQLHKVTGDAGCSYCPALSSFSLLAYAFQSHNPKMAAVTPQSCFIPGRMKGRLKTKEPISQSFAYHTEEALPGGLRFYCMA